MGESKYVQGRHNKTGNRVHDRSVLAVVHQPFPRLHVDGLDAHLVWFLLESRRCARGGSTGNVHRSRTVGDDASASMPAVDDDPGTRSGGPGSHRPGSTLHTTGAVLWGTGVYDSRTLLRRAGLYGSCALLWGTGVYAACLARLRNSNTFVRCACLCRALVRRRARDRLCQSRLCVRNARVRCLFVRADG